MTTFDKLQSAGSGSGPIGRPARTGETDGGNDRQFLAAGGKHLPPDAGQHLPEELRKQELDQAVRNVSGYVQNIVRKLSFSIDEDSGRTVVSVIDEVTGEVIRQIPTEDMLKIARNLAEIKERTVKGLLFQGDA